MTNPMLRPAWPPLVALFVFASTVVIFDSTEATRSHAYLRSVADPSPLSPSSIVASSSVDTSVNAAPLFSLTAAFVEDQIPTPTPHRRRLVIVNDAEELRAALQPYRLAAPLHLSHAGVESSIIEEIPQSGSAAEMEPEPNAWGYSTGTTIIINSPQPIELSTPLVVPAGADVRLASSGTLLDSPSGRAALRGRDTRLIEVWTCDGGLASPSICDFCFFYSYSFV